MLKISISKMKIFSERLNEVLTGSVIHSYPVLILVLVVNFIPCHVTYCSFPNSLIFITSLLEFSTAFLVNRHKVHSYLTARVISQDTLSLSMIP